MSTPRILVLHASAGAGHTQAAVALTEAFRQLAPGVDVLVADSLQFSTRVFRRAYVSSYNNIVRRAPGLWGYLYARTVNKRFDRITAPPRLAFDKLSVRRMREYLRRERPDAVVSTHFLPLALLSDLRVDHPEANPWPLYCVITDFTAHPFWVHPGITRYCVGAQVVVDELGEQGVPAGRVDVTGIPVNPRFALRGDPAEARARLGLDPGRPTALVMGGGVGMGRLAEVVEQVLAADQGFQCIAVCGRNARLRRALQGRYEEAEERDGRIAIRGFVRDVDRLMDAASLVLSKAGGLTSSESLAKGLPLLVLDPIPGQEERNCNYLVGAGAGIRLESVLEVQERVLEVLRPGGKQAALAAAAGRAGRPNAARDVAAKVLRELGAGVPVGAPA